MQEPFNLTLDQIGDLTDYQLLRIYFRPRKGDKTDRDDEPGQSYRDVYEAVWAARGLTPLQIEALYRREFPDGA